MVVCIPVTADGNVGDGWGRAHDVVVADVDGASGEIQQWEEFSVRWDELHDQNGEGQHHARIARFLMDHHVARVVCGHMGPGMLHMLQRMNIGVVLDIHGNARDAASQYGLRGPS